MRVRCHLVLAEVRGRIKVRRVTAKRGWLDAGEASIALELDVPDDVFASPLFTVEVEKRHVEVGVEPVPVDD